MRGDELYVWQERNDEGWGVIAGGFVDAGGVRVVRALVTRSRALAEGQWREYAEAHQQHTGNLVRLGKFKLSVVLEIVR